MVRLVGGVRGWVRWGGRVVGCCGVGVGRGGEGGGGEEAKKKRKYWSQSVP